MLLIPFVWKLKEIKGCKCVQMRPVSVGSLFCKKVGFTSWILGKDTRLVTADVDDAQRFNCRSCARVPFDVADKPPLRGLWIP